jgi:hypothetical protein
MGEDSAKSPQAPCRAEPAPVADDWKRFRVEVCALKALFPWNALAARTQWIC